MEDWSKEPTGKVWIRHVLDEMVPKLADSALVIQLVPNNDEGDVKFWVELGASIMYDKPILAIVTGGREIPEKLRRVADEIVFLPNGVDPAGSEAVGEAIKRMMGDD